MNKILWSLLLFAITVFGLSYFFGSGKISQATAEKERLTEQVSQPGIASEAVVGDFPSENFRQEADDHDDIKVGGLKLSVGSREELQEALKAAVSQRLAAEESLQIVELEIGALESQLDDIVLRGDDPVDAPDETLDAFQKIFADYQDSIRSLEEAQEKQAWLELKLAEFVDSPKK